MKKKMLFVVAALIIGAVTVFNVKTVLDANRTYDLAMTSIDALSEDGEGENGDQESNNHGSGKFFYEHLQGRPDDCTLYRYINMNGQIIYSKDKLSLGAEWKSSKGKGLKENCPKDGNGCTAYTCQATN